MTDSKALQDIIRKIDELTATLEAYMLEVNKDIQHLYAKDLDRGDQIYDLGTRVDDLEKDK